MATPAAPKRSFRKIAGVSLAIVVMLGATIAGVGYLLSNPLGGSEPVSVVEDPSSVRFDQRIAVTGTGPALREQIADAAEEAPSTGSIVDIAPDSLGTDPFGTLGIRAPSILTRNLEGEVTIGGVRTDAGAHPFMVLPVSSYERTFAGMLAWEATMRESLAPWYPEYQAVLATSTSASSASSATVLPFFVDTVVENRDVRALRDTAGRTVLLYGYADKETLLIVRDEDAFSAVLARLSR